MNKTIESKAIKLTERNKFVNKINLENKSCPRCGYKLTIYSIMPLKGTSKYKWMRVCPHCELIWPQ